MELEKLVRFDYRERPIIPEKYRAQFPYLLTISNKNFYAFDYICCRIKTPRVEDFMAAAEYSKQEYLVFGESEGYDWSDAGCTFLYAIALTKPFVEDKQQVLDSMWRKWLRDNKGRDIILTKTYTQMLYIERGNRDSCIFGYCGQPIYDRCVTNWTTGDEAVYECFDNGKIATLNRQQMAEWISQGKVANARIYRRPLKNGEPRISVTPLREIYDRS